MLLFFYFLGSLLQQGPVEVVELGMFLKVGKGKMGEKEIIFPSLTKCDYNEWLGLCSTTSQTTSHSSYNSVHKNG